MGGQRGVLRWAQLPTLWNPALNLQTLQSTDTGRDPRQTGRLLFGGLAELYLSSVRLEPTLATQMNRVPTPRDEDAVG